MIFLFKSLVMQLVKDFKYQAQQLGTKWLTETVIWLLQILDSLAKRMLLFLFNMEQGITTTIQILQPSIALSKDQEGNILIFNSSNSNLMILMVTMDSTCIMKSEEILQAILEIILKLEKVIPIPVHMSVKIMYYN